MNNRRTDVLRKIRGLLPFLSGVVLGAAIVFSVQVLPELKLPAKNKKVEGVKIVKIMNAFKHFTLARKVIACGEDMSDVYSDALQAFTMDSLKSGKPMPDEVSLADLLEEGYITRNNSQIFEGMDPRFRTEFDNLQVGDVLAYVRMPDDHFVCAFSDGSVRHLTRSGFEEYLINNGHEFSNIISNERTGPGQLDQSGKNNFDRL